MVANLGYGALIIAFFLTLYTAVLAIWGGLKKVPEFVESARLGLLLVFPLACLAAGCLIYLLVNGHYEVQYVFNVVSNNLPVYLRVTALWGGQAGSLLFWTWLMAGFAALITNNHWDRDNEFLPWVITVLSVTMAFFLSLSVFLENPFVRFWELPDGTQLAAMVKPVEAVLLIPNNGYGLNPLLRHPGMVFHPPLLYMGFVAFVIPFAFAIAALITGRTDNRWIRLTRRWSLLAWLFLSLGLILGSRWAYDVLGWGGYWSWDPVEIAAFMPWLTGTALLHSVMSQEKMGLFKRWNMVLVILTYDLVIFGTFLTRSGVLSSVHAFSQSSIGTWFLIFIGVTFAISLGLVLWRWDDLRAENPMSSLFSRESVFLFNNLVFMGIFFVCFWGVLYPVATDVFTGQKVTVGPPFYERATGPLFAALLLLMGIAPLTAWGHSTGKTLGNGLIKPLLATLLAIMIILASGVRSAGAVLGFGLVALVVSVTVYEYGRGVASRHIQTGEPYLVSFWKLAGRNRRRYGGYIIHLGVVMMALGIIGIELFQTETQGTIARGQSLSLSGYSFTFRDLAVFDTSDRRNVARAVINVKKGDRVIGEIYPRRDYYYESQQPVTVPGVLGSLDEDLYVVLVDWQPINSQGSTFKVYVNPLINWLWLGGFVFILGTLVAAWPDFSFEEERLVRMATKLSAEDSSR
jgi:cytochrome c-type biogenesis protein CcmF